MRQAMLLVVVALAAACSGEPSGGAAGSAGAGGAGGMGGSGGAGGSGGSGGAPMDTTVEQIQRAQVPEGSHVHIASVFATGIGPEKFFAADALAAAQYAGVLVMAPSTGVSIGSAVELTGIVREVDGETRLVADPGGVSVLAAPGFPPVPLAGVLLRDVASLADGEPYEGVLVQLGPISVRSSSAAGNQLTLTDGTNELLMDDDLFGFTAALYPASTCFGAVTGIMAMNAGGAARKVLPRSQADLVVGAGCP